MKSRSTLAALAVIFAVCSVRAEEFKHRESGLQFTLPEGWTCTEKDNKIFIENQDKTSGLRRRRDTSRSRQGHFCRHSKIRGFH
jgi:hypothetical protein